MNRLRTYGSVPLAILRCRRLIHREHPDVVLGIGGFTAGPMLLAARVTLSPTFTVLGRDTILSNTALAGTSFFGANYDVTRDGKRILGILPDQNDFQLVISPNWITELRRRVAESRGAK